MRSGSSYCSASELALTFGLAKDANATAVEVEWPSGAKSRMANVKANQVLAITEP